MKHKFIKHPEGEGTDFCKFELCTICGCVKEVWRKGVSFRLEGLYFDKEPNCKQVHIN